MPSRLGHAARRVRGARIRALLGLLMAVMMAAPTRAASLTDRDVLLMARITAFLEPRPSGPTIVAIACDTAAADSRQDAEAIVALFGSGVKSGPATLLPRIVDSRQLLDGGFAVIITARGADVERVAAAARRLHVLSLTGDRSLIRTGQVIMAVTSDPKAQIVLSREAASKSEVTFVSAFLMMIEQY